MRYSAVAARRVAAGLGLTLLAVTAGAGVARATGTAVGATICGVGSGATLGITSPHSDSVLDQPTVTVSGPVSSATQIKVEINGQYDSTIPLDPQQTAYSTTVNLPRGTQTITLTANDICQVHDAVASVVVTYQPQVSPGAGDTTPTQVGGGVSVGGAPVTPAGGQPVTVPLAPVLGSIKLAQLLRALDFDTTAMNGPLRAIVRIGSAIVGLVLLLGGARVLGWWHWSHARAKDSIVRLIGLALLSLLLVV